MNVYTVFYSVPGQYLSSTVVRAANKEAAADMVSSKFAGGRAVVTGVMVGQ